MYCLRSKWLPRHAKHFRNAERSSSYGLVVRFLDDVEVLGHCLLVLKLDQPFSEFLRRQKMLLVNFNASFQK